MTCCRFGCSKVKQGLRTLLKTPQFWHYMSLTEAGYGIRHSYSEGVQQPRPGFTLTFRDALAMVLNNVMLLFLVPRKALKSPFVPQKLRDVGRAIREFQQYMEDMLAKERRLISQRKPGDGNLMSALIRVLEEEKRNDHAATLTDEEILGNIFIYAIAGHETTANSMAYAIVLLAAYPEWQDWLAEEVRSVLGNAATEPNSWTYETSFPKLRRCLAVMVRPHRF